MDRASDRGGRPRFPREGLGSDVGVVAVLRFRFREDLGDRDLLSKASTMSEQAFRFSRGSHVLALSGHPRLINDIGLLGI
jgi:hypothetical protein